MNQHPQVEKVYSYVPQHHETLYPQFQQEIKPEIKDAMMKLEKAYNKIIDTDLEFAKKPLYGDLIIKNEAELLLIIMHRQKRLSEKTKESTSMFSKMCESKSKLFSKK